MKYRKKPVVVDAVQYRAGEPFPPGVCDCHPDGVHFREPHVHTLEGVMTVTDGDWIITGVAGEQYPCHPDIFAQTYEAVK